MIEISVVSPVYQADTLVKKLVSLLRYELGKISSNYEIILVDDRSRDNGWSEIRHVCASFHEVRGIRLSRNFGQHSAISAGLAAARGKWVVVMDCDLQDQPNQIPRLLAEALKGFDVVMARRATRQDTRFKKLTSIAFYRLLGYLTGDKQDPSIANFGIYSQKVVAAVNALPETVRYFPTMVRWLGFNATTLDVEHAQRPEGKTSYSFSKLLRLGIDACIMNSEKPLRLVVKTGFGISLVGFLFAIYTAIKAVQGEIEVLGYASLLVSIWILSGLVIFIIGIVGLYVGKSFEGIKGRPAYIIDEVLNSGD